MTQTGYDRHVIAIGRMLMSLLGAERALADNEQKLSRLAFSPTDTILLSSRAKMLMGMESIEALIASLLVISRGVSLLH